MRYTFIKEHDATDCAAACIDDLFFVVAIIAGREHPYYSFVIFGGMLVGIIQSEWCYRKISEETNWSKIDILFKKGENFVGSDIDCY